MEPRANSTDTQRRKEENKKLEILCTKYAILYTQMQISVREVDIDTIDE